ncbi:hypothetical protein M758_6G079700 [Ceratodon purpureus]|uniref:Uncharacterized protein n=1 Tax=Ceratodon purpureus TaxID=3225 RepID=A0A8T0HFT7_CERPU|nr:hypothetical protein KC19_6G084300 [Ceratodon purpureus]KAG0613143.1 hypothetical protein M758_6G079700 [Ceratodon purpureus]
MTTAVLSHRLAAFATVLSCARGEELRGVLSGGSLLCRSFAVRGVRGGFSRLGRSECRIAGRIAPVLVSKQRRLISKDAVRARALENGSDAELDPREGGDKLVRVISKDAEVSVLSLVATEVVREAQQRHSTSPIAIAALGRTLMGTLLLGALKGDAETVQVVFLGDGPLGQMTAISSDGGYVKGFVGNPLCDALYKENGKLSVGLAVGSGVLSVVRNNRKWKQPYTGTIPIYSGEVAEDIAHYLADSEQMNTALGLGVGFDKEVGIKFAGGFLVQILPFCSDETLAKLEENILKMKPLAEAPSDCKASDIVEAILDGIGVGDYNNGIIPRYGPCGVELLKPRMMRAVASLGPVEVQQILDEQGSVEVRCEYCGDVAQFSEADLQQVLQSSS